MKKRELYLEQQLHASLLAQALDKHGAALDASSTGCGKTLVAAEITSLYRQPTLIVGLKGSLPMWRDEMQVRGWPCLGAINYEMLRTGKTPWGEWYLNKQWQWKLPKDTLIIWDEVHNCQGVNSLNSKMLIGSKNFRNLLLSATAAEDPTEMRALGFILGIHNLRDWFGWCKKQGCRVDPWGHLKFGTGNKAKDDAIIAALHQQIFPEHGSRLTLDDMKEHFMETQIITTPLDFGEEIEEIYESMEAELTNLAEIMVSDSDNPAAEALVAKLRARQKVELLKVPLMIEMTEDLIREGRSVVLFVNFDATIKALTKRLKGAEIISGKAPRPRHEVEQAFLRDEFRLVICNSQAGGTSLSLHDINGKYPRTSIISPDWNAKKTLQLIGRIHRAGGKTPSQQHILFAANTVEVEVKNAVTAGMRRLGIFNDGLLKKQPIITNKIVDVPPPECEASPTVIEKPADPLPPKEEAHAEFNPSSLGSFEKCPGYLNRNTESESSLRGTRIHKALEKDTIHTLADAEKPVAQACKDFIDALIAERLPQKPSKDFREIRLQIDLGGDITTFGTCDRLLIYGEEGLMCDYKSGWREITPAENNAQAWSYVIGAFQLHPQLQKITFYFLVPNRDEILFHTFLRSDVPAMILRLNTIIRRAMEADPKLFNPQPELCEYCARQASCPALAKKVLPILSKLSAGLPVPTNIIVSKDRLADIPHLLRLAPILENFASEIRSAALRVNLEEGIDVPGFKLVERSTPRKIISVLGAWDVLKQVEPNISLEDFLAACSQVSMPDLETLIASLAPKNQKGSAKKKFEQQLRGADLLRDEGKIHYLKEQKK